MNDDVKCPYCNKPQEINHDDGQGYEESVPHQQTCSDCEKIFVFTTCISMTYYPAKADCLNEDGEHDLRYMCGSPRAFFVGKKRCFICDEEVLVDPEASKKAMAEYTKEMDKQCRETVKTVEKFVDGLQQGEKVSEG